MRHRKYRKYGYDIFEFGERLHQRISMKKACEIVGVSTTKLSSLANSGQAHNGLVVKKIIVGTNPQDKSWNCQNPKCETREKRYKGSHFGYIDEFMGEIKLCKSCEGVKIK